VVPLTGTSARQNDQATYRLAPSASHVAAQGPTPPWSPGSTSPPLRTQLSRRPPSASSCPNRVRAPRLAFTLRVRSLGGSWEPNWEPRPASTGGLPQSVLTIKTAQRARWATEFGTEPSTRRAPRMPLLPTTTRSAPTEAAVSTIASTAEPAAACAAVTGRHRATT
jgi:hypothetical protein